MSVPGGILHCMSGGRLSDDGKLVRIIATDRLVARGISPERIKTLIRRGTLIRVGRGWYVTARTGTAFQGHPDGPHLLSAGAVLAGSGPDLVASHTTAARIHGLDLLDRPGETVTVTRAPGNGSRRSKQRVRLRVAAVPASQVTARYGLRVTTVARTVIDVARTSSFRAGVVTADSALRTKQTSNEELRAILAMCSRWPGVTQATAVVDFADMLSESALESIARVVFRESGLPPPQLQAWVGGDERIGRVDFLWKQFNTIVEVDGALKYADPDRARQQLRRDAKLRQAGFEVLHFTWWEITQTPENVAASIQAAFARGLAIWGRLDAR